MAKTTLACCWEGAGWATPAQAREGCTSASTGIFACSSGMFPGTQWVQLSLPKSPSCIFLPRLKSTAEGSLLYRNQINLPILFTSVFLTQIYYNETLWNWNIRCTAFHGNNSGYHLYLYSLSFQHILCSG